MRFVKVGLLIMLLLLAVSAGCEPTFTDESSNLDDPAYLLDYGIGMCYNK
jgi:hypothetical protein